MKMYRDVCKNVDLSKIDVVHAHTWFSDGGVAYKLFKKYHIPYVVAIRSTDVDFFYKYLRWERSFAMKILENACRVIFISKHHHLSMQGKFPLDIRNKCQVLPNGVDQFWLERFNSKAEKLEGRIKVLYVGQFIKRKNVHKLYYAVRGLRREGFNIELHLVGNINGAFKEKVESSSDWIKQYGVITSKEDLRKVFCSCDIFAMPSVNETFGLVFIEALSQGLPILYTCEDGVDGFYKSVGEGVVKPVIVEGIKSTLKRIIDSYSSYDIPQDLLRKNHSWQEIAKTYMEIYWQCK